MSKWARLIAVFLLAAAVVWAFAWQRNVQAQSVITEVSILHTGCFGTCPAYEVILRRNGTATFIGSNHVSKIGTYQAQLSGFDRLTRAIEQRGFQQFKSQYTVSLTDMPHTIITVVQGSRRKTVDNYADTGPQRLWEIQTLIDGTVAEAHWKKISSSTNYR